MNVTDNKYHTIIVKRLGNYATLQVDYAGKVEGSTGGTSHLMNHGGGALFAGNVYLTVFRHKVLDLVRDSCSLIGQIGIAEASNA